MRHALRGRTDICVRNLKFFGSTVAPSALTACMLAGLMTASAFALQFATLPPTGRASETYGPGKPIEAWIKFCTRYQDECRVNAYEAETIELTAKVWALI